MRATIASRNDRRSRDWNRIARRAFLCAMIASTAASGFGDEPAKGPIRANPYIKSEPSITRPSPNIQLASGTAITLKPKSRSGLVNIGNGAAQIAPPNPVANSQITPSPVAAPTSRREHQPSIPTVGNRGEQRHSSAILRELKPAQPLGAEVAKGSLPIIHYGNLGAVQVTEAPDRLALGNAFDSQRQRGVVTLQEATPTAPSTPTVVSPELNSTPAVIMPVTDSREDAELVKATQPIFFSLTDGEPSTEAEIDVVEAVEEEIQAEPDEAAVALGSNPSADDSADGVPREDDAEQNSPVIGAPADEPTVLPPTSSSDTLESAAEAGSVQQPEASTDSVVAKATQSDPSETPEKQDSLPEPPLPAPVQVDEEETAEPGSSLVQLAEPVDLSPIQSLSDREQPVEDDSLPSKLASPGTVASLSDDEPKPPVVRYNPNVVRNDRLANFRSKETTDPRVDEQFSQVRTTRPLVAVSALPIVVERTESQSDLSPTVDAVVSNPLENLANPAEIPPTELENGLAKMPNADTPKDAVVRATPEETTRVAAASSDQTPEGQQQLPEWEPDVNPAMTTTTVSVARPENGRFLEAPNAPAPTVGGPIEQTQETTPSEVTLHLTRAQVRSMTIGGRLKRVSISNKDVCQAFASSSSQIKLIGTGLGKTNLTIWADVDPTEPTRVQTFVIEVAEAVDAKGDKVSENTKLLNDSIARAFPTANVRVQRVGSELTVSGTCYDERTAKQIIRMVRKSCLVPVNDQLKIR